MTWSAQRTAPDVGAVHVAYIAGWVRSGTTLACEMIGAFDGALALGEISGIWGAARDNIDCSCGRPIRDCALWSHVLPAALAASGVDDYDELSRIARSVLRTREAPFLTRLDMNQPQAWPSQVRRYVAAMECLFHELAVATGGKTLVDSSKLPPGFLVQRLMPSVRTRLVHVVRDPRAVANSERNTWLGKSHDAGQLPPGKSAVKSVLMWGAFNGAVRCYRRHADGYLTVSYEELCSHTDVKLEELARFLDLRRRPNGVLLDAGHIAVGNPSRLGGSARGIRQDDAWKSELPTLQRGVVGTIGWPMWRWLR